MKPRTGVFVEYGGVDCRVIRIGGVFHLERLDRAALTDGFFEAYPGHFQKAVSNADIENAFAVRPFVVYKKVEFPVMGVHRDQDILTIVTYNPSLAKRFQMVLIDQNTYALDVAFCDVEWYREEREETGMRL